MALALQVTIQFLMQVEDHHFVETGEPDLLTPTGV
jgi:hypothetical protein